MSKLLLEYETPVNSYTFPYFGDITLAEFVRILIQLPTMEVSRLPLPEIRPIFGVENTSQRWVRCCLHDALRTCSLERELK